MCRVLKVSRSGYYAWRVRPLSDRDKTDRVLTGALRRLHAKSKGVYGSPKLVAELKDEGYCYGRRKVARLMRLAGLRGCPKRRFRVTTKRDPSHPVAAESAQTRLLGCTGAKSTLGVGYHLYLNPPGMVVSCGGDGSLF